MAYLAQAVTIAASDSSGGAGIQADIKAMHANGVFGISVLVAITAQNTKAVTMVSVLPREIIEAQIDAVFEDFEIEAVKTGMLFSPEIVEIVSARLRVLKAKNLVVDPVMFSKSGRELLQPEAIEKVRSDLFPLARIVTPNIPEAQRLSGVTIKTVEDAQRAAEAIYKSGCQSVLIKGGHLLQNRATDILFDGKTFTTIPGEFIDTPHTHGTGCTYASAIAAHLALGKELGDAVRVAKSYLTEAIRHSLSIGHGHGPTDHFYFLRPSHHREHNT